MWQRDRGEGRTLHSIQTSLSQHDPSKTEGTRVYPPSGALCNPHSRPGVHIPTHLVQEIGDTGPYSSYLPCIEYICLNYADQCACTSSVKPR